MKGLADMKAILSLVVTLGFLGGCATVPPGTSPTMAGGTWITPEQAVLSAARAAPAGVPGTFAMRVQATGVEDGRFYLNSERDYRDQRNLTIALSAQAARQLAERLGSDPMETLKGKDVLVIGSAFRTTIYFFANGRPTDKYYYQTHVNVTDAAQITIR
jgi:hypothetical protein